MNKKLEQDGTLHELKLMQDVSNNKLEDWPGRWMPDRPGDPTPPPKVLPKNEQEHYDSVTELSHKMQHIQMGHVSPDCDDAKVYIAPQYVFLFK